MIPFIDRISPLKIAVLAGLLPLSAANAELVFDRQEVKSNTSVLASDLVGRFAFKNTGTKDIKITSMQSCCSCTKASTTKQTFAPGESGEIVITFAIGNRHGLQRKGVVVSTNEPEQRPYPLFVTADIPTVLTPSSQVLLWKEGEAAEAKKLVVNTLSAPGVRELRAHSESNSVRAAVERASDTRFNVSVTPSSHARNISDTLHLDALMENGHVKRSSVYVRIR